MGGAGAFHRDDDGARAEFFASCEVEFIFVKAVHVRIETNGIGGKFCGQLCGNRAHATRGDGRVPFGKHLENEFKHAARGFEFLIEENAAEKRTEEAVDEFLGEAERLERVFGEALRAGKNFLDGFAAKA